MTSFININLEGYEEIQEIANPTTPITNYARLFLSSITGDLSVIKDTGAVINLEEDNDTTDHGAFTGLGDDDHTQYLLLAGRATGQTAIGGTGAGEDLTLTSTAHATKGNIIVTDPILAPDGLVGAPAYSFSSAPTTGWWLEPSGDLTSSVGGQEILEIQADGRVIISVNTPNYEDLVTADNVIPNKKYVDCAIPLEYWDAIVDTVASDKPNSYTTIDAAITAGALTIFVRDGAHTMTATAEIPDGGHIRGESMGGTQITISGSFSISADGSGGTNETAGTISITHNTTAVTGSGTTFTNLNPVGSNTYIIIEQNAYLVSSVTDNTNLTLGTTFKGNTVSGGSYIAQQMKSHITMENFTVINSTIAGLRLRALRHSSFNDIVSRGCTPGIEMDECVNTNLSNIIAQNSAGHGFHITNDTSDTFTSCQSFNSSLDGFRVDGASKNIMFNGIQGSNNLQNGLYINGTSTNIGVSEECIFNNNKLKGIDIISGTGTVTIAGVHCVNNDLDGIDFDGTDNTVQGCVCSSNGRYGIRAGDNGSIIGNQCDSNGDSGIRMNVDSQCTVVGNRSTNNTLHGIYMDENRNTVGSNFCSGNAGDGIHITLGDENHVHDNISYNNTGWGIRILDAGATNNRIINNHVFSNTAGQYSDAGTTTLIVKAEDTVQHASTATDHALARFDLTSGRLIQNSGAILDDSNNLSGIVNFVSTGYSQFSDISTPANAADGQGRLYKKSGDDGIWWKPNSGGSEVDLTSTGAGGEVNTASNVGTAGVGVFKTKSGVDLQFKKINAGSNKITITDDVGNNEVDIDAVEANFILDNIGGTLSVNKGGTGTTTHTLNAILKGNTTSSIISSGVSIDGSNNMSGMVNISSTAGYLQLTDMTAPANPADAQGRIYKKTGNDGLFWKPDSAGLEVDLSNGGEANTSSSAGGTSLVKAKVGVDLPFKGLTATSTKIALSANTNDIGIDVTEANLTLGNLGGTLGISKGGTGQITATAAFNALDPLTTKGDIIAHNGTNSIRVAVGTNDQMLVADSTQASGVKWSSPSIVGTEYTYAESLGTTSGTNTTYLQKLRLTTASLPAGDYKISWSLQISTDKNTIGVGFRVQVDDTTTLQEVSHIVSSQDDYFPRSGFAKVTLTAATHDIDLDYLTNSGTGRGVNVKDVRLEIFRVS